MIIAVTGASGFIGRHVLKELALHPVDVVAVSRDAGKLVDYAGTVRIVELEVGNTEKNYFEHLGRPDVLIHLAWDGLPNYTSLHHFETELPHQYHFLKSMVDSGLPAMLVTGTCYEYGIQYGELSEELPTLPVNPYGYSKDALRRQLEFLRLSCPFSLTWARLFYMYGDGQAESSLFSLLKRAVERGDARFNMSGGEQLRDYLPVEKVARDIVACVIQKADVGVVNICSGNPVSIRALVECWLRKYGWNIKLNLGHYPYPDYEPMGFWGNRGKLNRLLGTS